MNYLNTNSPITQFYDTIHDSIYVDKSLLIDAVSVHIHKPMTKYLCITRPKSFGKTINANMLAAYYTKGFDSHELFNQLHIAKTEDYGKHMNQYNVIYIDFSKLSDAYNQYEQYIKEIKNNIFEDIEKQYGILRTEGMSIGKLLKKTHDSFIFVLDGWDSIFCEDFMSEDNKLSYLKFLKDLFKDQNYVDLVYMTGISSVPQCYELNMFKNYSLINDKHYHSFFGYTEDEVKGLCYRFKKPTYEEFQYWDNGYYNSGEGRLFNPLFINHAFLSKTKKL